MLNMLTSVKNYSGSGGWWNKKRKSLYLLFSQFFPRHCGLSKKRRRERRELQSGMPPRIWLLARCLVRCAGGGSQGPAPEKPLRWRPLQRRWEPTFRLTKEHRTPRACAPDFPNAASLQLGGYPVLPLSPPLAPDSEWPLPASSPPHPAPPGLEVTHKGRLCHCGRRVVSNPKLGPALFRCVDLFPRLPGVPPCGVMACRSSLI